MDIKSHPHRPNTAVVTVDTPIEATLLASSLVRPTLRGMIAFNFVDHKPYTQLMGEVAAHYPREATMTHRQLNIAESGLVERMAPGDDYDRAAAMALIGLTGRIQNFLGNQHQR